MTILERDEIWFTHVGEFEDPYEGTLPRANQDAELDEIKSRFDMDTGIIEQIYEAMQKELGGISTNAYVNCWNISDHQSTALWEQYVSANEGVVIRSTINNLQQALESAENEFIFGSIDYKNYKKDRIPRGGLSTVFHKRNSFEHENEFRIAYRAAGGQEEISGKGFYAEVNVDDLIDKVIISPISHDWFSGLVNTFVDDKYDIDCEVKNSELYSGPDDEDINLESWS